MRTLDWREYETADRRIPLFPQDGTFDFLAFTGYFHPIFSAGIGSRTDPRREREILREIVEKVERTLLLSYGGRLQIEGMQTPDNKHHPTQDNLRYLASLYALEDGCRVLGTNMTVVHSENKAGLTAPFLFKGVFPLGDYDHETEEAVRRIWPLFRGLESMVRNGGGISIQLFEGGKEQLGYEDLRNAGLTLPSKMPVIKGAIF